MGLVKVLWASLWALAQSIYGEQMEKGQQLNKNKIDDGIGSTDIP